MKILGWILVFALGITIGVMSMTRRDRADVPEDVEQVDAHPDSFSVDDLVISDKGSRSVTDDRDRALADRQVAPSDDPAVELSNREAQIRHFLQVVERLERSSQ